MRKLLKFVSGKELAGIRYGSEGELVVLWVAGTKILEGQKGPFHDFHTKLWISWCVFRVSS